MDGFEKREECISNLIQQIGWIEDIDAHKFPGWGHTVNAMRQAIALLKAQEPVEPTWRRGVPFCSKCGRQFGRGNKYCPDCGQAVRWE